LADRLNRQPGAQPHTLKIPSMSSITMRFLAEPSTVNFGGKVHGGTVMKWIDEAGYACATRWAKRYCVTVSVGSIRFKRPIMIGDLVEVEAQLAYTGSTSMNISVEVRAGDMKLGEMQVITDCLVVFVAVDLDGKALPIEPWHPATPGDMALAQNVKAHLDALRALQSDN
jgi:acyl-CoA hydrolase